MSQVDLLQSFLAAMLGLEFSLERRWAQLHWMDSAEESYSARKTGLGNQAGHSHWPSLRLTIVYLSVDAYNQMNSQNIFTLLWLMVSSLFFFGNRARISEPPAGPQRVTFSYGIRLGFICIWISSIGVDLAYPYPWALSLCQLHREAVCGWWHPHTALVQSWVSCPCYVPLNSYKCPTLITAIALILLH
jgi:hypothetical protein